ncbi:hypothetical protein [Gordonia iterans]
MNDEHHLPNTYRGIEDTPEPPVTWTNLPPGYTAVPMDHAADLAEALGKSVNVAALSINHAAEFGDSVLSVVRSATLCSESFDAERLRQLVGCLAICLRRAHQDSD